MCSSKLQKIFFFQPLRVKPKDMETCRLVFPCFLHVASVYLLLIYPRFSLAASVYLVFVFPRFSQAACVHHVFVFPRFSKAASVYIVFVFPRFSQAASVYLVFVFPRFSLAASVYLVFVFPRFSQAACVHHVFVFPRFSKAASVYIVFVFPRFSQAASVYLVFVFPRFSQAASVYLVFVFPRFSQAVCVHVVHVVFVVPRFLQVASNTWLFQARKSRLKQNGFRIYSNKRLPRISAAFETKKFISAAVPMRRLFEEFRIIPYSKNSVKSKTTLEMSFLQKWVVVEGGAGEIWVEWRHQRKVAKEVNCENAKTLLLLTVIFLTDGRYTVKLKETISL